MSKEVYQWFSEIGFDLHVCEACERYLADNDLTPRDVTGSPFRRDPLWRASRRNATFVESWRSKRRRRGHKRFSWLGANYRSGRGNMAKIKAVNPEQAWRNWLANNPCPPDAPGAPTINLWIPKAARACHRCMVQLERAVELIRQVMTRREKTPYEVTRAVERIYGGKLASIGAAKVELQPYDPNKLARIAANVPFAVTPDWLRSMSPVCLL